MGDIDEALAKLARAPFPHAPDLFEARVLTRIGATTVSRPGIGMGAISAVALAIGVVGAGVPASPSNAATLSPFGVNSPLAPSTLLTGLP